MPKRQERITLIKTQRKNYLRQMQPFGLKKLSNQSTKAKLSQHQSAVQLVLNTQNTSRVFSVVRNIHTVCALSWYAGRWKCVIHQ